MRSQNEKPAAPKSPRPTWTQVLVVVGAIICSTALAVAFYPPAFEAFKSMFEAPLSGASAARRNAASSPGQARKHRMADAQTAVHGMFVKDTYGCMYLFQYVNAQLTLTPVMNEHGQQVCNP